MATNVRLLKLTNTEAIIKIDGDLGEATIDLDVTLLGDNEELDGSTQKVNIVSMLLPGLPGGIATVKRNNEELWHISVDSAVLIDMQTLGCVSDNINNTSDINVTLSVAKCELIMKLRKVSGYKTKIQPEQYSIYDNPASANS